MQSVSPHLSSKPTGFARIASRLAEASDHCSSHATDLELLPEGTGLGTGRGSGHGELMPSPREWEHGICPLDSALRPEGQELICLDFTFVIVG